MLSLTNDMDSGGSEERNRGLATMDRALLCPLTPLHPHPRQKIPADVIEIRPSDQSIPRPLPSSSSLISFFLPAQNSHLRYSDVNYSPPKIRPVLQPTLHTLNDKRISHCGAYVVTGDHDSGALQTLVDLRFLSFIPIRSTLIFPLPTQHASLDRLTGGTIRSLTSITIISCRQTPPMTYP